MQPGPPGNAPPMTPGAAPYWTPNNSVPPAVGGPPRPQPLGVAPPPARGPAPPVPYPGGAPPMFGAPGVGYTQPQHTTPPPMAGAPNTFATSAPPMAARPPGNTPPLTRPPLNPGPPMNSAPPRNPLPGVGAPPRPGPPTQSAVAPPPMMGATSPPMQGYPASTTPVVAPPPGRPVASRPPQRYPGAPPPPQQQQQYAPSAPGQPAAAAGGPAPAAESTGANSKVRDDQMPRYLGPDPKDPDTYMTFEFMASAVVPGAGSRTRIIDDGNASPRYMRVTTQHFPETKDVAKAAGTPMALILQPLARPGHAEDPVPVVEMGPVGILRCVRCRAYMSCFTVFVDGGRRTLCNFCGANTDVPATYFCNTDSTGKRRDKYERPELHKGSVDFVATPEYCLRPPQPPAHMFVIDASDEAAASGLLTTSLAAVRQSIGDLLQVLDGDADKLFVGIMTFDMCVHMYDIQPGREHPGMFVVSDLEDPFAPTPNGCYAQYSQSKHLIDELLDTIPTLLGHDVSSLEPSAASKRHVCPGTATAAIAFARQIMHNRGGFLYAFVNTMPSRGPGALKPREDSKLLNTDDEKRLLNPGDPYYTTLANNLLESQVCVTIFAGCSSFVDLASVGHLADRTGGDVFHYFPFRHPDGSSEAVRLLKDVRLVMTRPRAYECMMRVRVNAGLAIKQYYGRYSMSNSVAANDDFDLPGLHCERTFGLELTFEGKISPVHPHSPFACLQTALLYTTLKGERRVRVHTLGLPAARNVPDVFRFADLDATVMLLHKQTLAIALTQSFAKVRENLMKLCVDLLVGYRAHCAPHDTPSGQLILPEGLKQLPLFVLAVTKHIMTKSNPEVKIDARIAALWRAASCPLEAATAFIHPRCIRVDDLAETDYGVANLDGTVVMPPVLGLSAEKLVPSGAYLFEDGFSAVLYLGRSISPQFLSQVCGVDSLEAVTQYSLAPEDTNDSMSTNGRFHTLLRTIQRQRRRNLVVEVVRPNTPLEASKVFPWLVEDRTQQSRSYMEFLCHVHRVIMQRMSD